MFDPDDIDNRNLRWVKRLIAPLNLAERYHRARVTGVDRVPDGAALFVGNHNGATLSIDTFLFALAYARERGEADLPYGLAHDLVLRIPGLNQFLAPLGVVRASPGNARRLFAAGRKVMVYPGGDVESMRSFCDRDRVTFDGRTGFARMAIEHGVPIVPVAAAGAHGTLLILSSSKTLARRLGLERWLRIKVLPVALSLPWGLTVGPVPPYWPLPTGISIEVLEPIRPERTGPEAAADAAYVAQLAAQVEQALQEAVTRLSKERRAARRRRGWLRRRDHGAAPGAGRQSRATAGSG
jgi:1-acyl-sn-glycerol-3-phosphate acyltransferase